METFGKGHGRHHQEGEADAEIRRAFPPEVGQGVNVMLFTTSQRPASKHRCGWRQQSADEEFGQRERSRSRIREREGPSKLLSGMLLDWAWSCLNAKKLCKHAANSVADASSLHNYMHDVVGHTAKFNGHRNPHKYLETFLLKEGLSDLITDIPNGSGMTAILEPHVLYSYLW